MRFAFRSFAFLRFAFCVLSVLRFRCVLRFDATGAMRFAFAFRVLRFGKSMELSCVSARIALRPQFGAT